MLNGIGENSPTDPVVEGQAEQSVALTLLKKGLEPFCPSRGNGELHNEVVRDRSLHRERDTGFG